MPAGDLITEDWQGELRATLLGEGSDYPFGPGAITGLGLPPLKTADVDLAHADGAYGSPDYLASRIITIPMQIGGSTDAAAMTALTDLIAAWAPSDVDIELHLRLPGWGHFKVSGRPRGLDAELAQLKSGEIATLGTFVALNPTITYL